jgi:molecular chaperone GrpE
MTERDESREPAGESPAEEGAPTGQVNAKIAELEDRWLRAVADLENLRKRIARDAARAREEERARVAGDWLPVLDNLELALKHTGDDEDGAVVRGLRAVRDQAVDVLARLGYTRHQEVGVPFDPTRHEAVATVSRPGVEPGSVVEVVRPGYGDGERQLRPAIVVVAEKAD